MRVKRPSFQFYPGDWLRATELRSCSVGARGLWIDMICLMHEGSPYGHLMVGDKVILPDNLARMVGATIEDVEGWLEELEQSRVFSRTDSGCIFSRRMLRDEEVRSVRAAGGVLGGNPALMNGRGKVGRKDNLHANLQPTPASASASASAIHSTTDVVEGGSAPPPCPHQAIVDIYHEELPAHPRVLALNESRRALIRGRWRQLWEERGARGRSREPADLLDRLRSYFASDVKQSPFLTGMVAPRDGRPVFIADFEWLMRPQNFLKVIEGKYSREAS